MKTKILSLLFISLLAGSAFAQTLDKTKLDAYFNALETNKKFSGSVSVSKDGKTIYSRSVGFADAQANKKLNENTKFRIGSVSKTFTTTLIFKAVEEKKLNLNDKLSSYFPTVPNASKITISNLLNHRSGIHNFTNDEDYTSWMTSPKTEAEMVAIIAKAKSDFEPDSKADYSNSNYVLLSYILEKAYKKPFKDILDQKIVKPLGLKNTSFGGKINTANNEAFSYENDNNKASETDISIPLGAGGIISTPNDLSRFIEALLAGKIISTDSVNQMKTIKDGYGMGLFQFPFDNEKGYGHTGGIDGFTSMLSYFPESKITFALTSNSPSFKNNDIAIACLSWANNKPFEIPNFITYTNTTEDLDKYLGNYASANLPFKIVITKDGTTLMAQATGQSAFPLEATDKDKFAFDTAGIVLEFVPEQNQMTLKQGGGVFAFTKE